MGYERYPRNTDPQGDYYNRSETQDYGRDYGAGRSGSYSSARDYQASGEIGGDRDRYRSDYGFDRGGRQPYGRSRDQDRYGRDDRYDRGDRGRGDMDRPYRGSYASDGRRFENVDRDDRDRYDQRGRGGRGDDGRQPQGYDYQDRGFFDRAGDEVRSWFGDEEAERRRDMDARYDERAERQRSNERDEDYHSWRRTQIDALDRDYDEYRRENRQRFHSEFGQWREKRQGQRDQLNKVDEHMEVVGSDGSHVGTVDKVRGDRVILTKNDEDAGGRHHSFPSSWIDSVDDKVKLSKSADDAKAHWKDEERNRALFGDDQDRDRDASRRDRSDQGTRTTLDKSFTGTNN